MRDHMEGPQQLARADVVAADITGHAGLPVRKVTEVRSDHDDVVDDQRRAAPVVRGIVADPELEVDLTALSERPDRLAGSRGEREQQVLAYGDDPFVGGSAPVRD